MSKQTYMPDGPCHQKHCMNNTKRCSRGYCPTCCRTFHDHVRGPSTTGNTNPVLISSAVQPEDGQNRAAAPAAPAHEYQPGVVRLVCSQDIKDINQLRR